MTMRMTPARPPAVAAWLFRHFACGPNADAVLGDLAEQYTRKSRMWYWRQVLKGIPVSVVTEALGHKAIAAGAIVTGCIAWIVFLEMYPSFVLGSVAGPVLGFDVVTALFSAPPGMGVWAAAWSPVAFSLFFPSTSTAFQLWTQIALPLVGWTACGWIVTRVDIGRTHRDLAPLFAGFILLLNLVFAIPGVTRFLAAVRSEPFGSSGALSSVEAVDLIAPTAANAAVAVFGILLGGSLRRTRSGGAAMTALMTPILAGAMVFGQDRPVAAAQQAPPPRFDVVSVKPSAPEPTDGPMLGMPGAFMPGGPSPADSATTRRFVALNAELEIILHRAYPEFARPGMLIAPDWIADERFDIDGRAGTDVPVRLMRLMLRQLLVDRFAMQSHTEMRLVDTYHLVLARGDGNSAHA